MGTKPTADKGVDTAIHSSNMARGVLAKSAIGCLLVGERSDKAGVAASVSLASLGLATGGAGVGLATATGMAGRVLVWSAGRTVSIVGWPK